jgi:hypothetical protein
MRYFLLIGMVATISLGCWHRGDFTILARVPVAASGRSGVPVTGMACFNMPKNYTFQGDAVFEFAVRDAVSKVPGANALINATFTDRGECVHVEGTAVTR